MVVDAESFMRNLTPKGVASSLKQYEADILKLRERGLSLQQVADFLAANGTVTSLGNLSKFVKRATLKGGRAASGKVRGAAGAVEVASVSLCGRAEGGESKEGERALVRPAGMTDVGWRDMMLAESKLRKFHIQKL